MRLRLHKRFKNKTTSNTYKNGYLYDRLSAQKFLALISLFIPLSLLCVYLLTPHASDSASGFRVVLISGLVIAVNAFRLLKNWNTPRGNGYQLVGAFFDFSAICAILIGYAHTYNIPISSALKSPTANVFFIYLASRIVLFHGPTVLKAGAIAITSWLALLALSVFDTQYVGRTSSYVDYLTSFKVLFGAEIERILQFGIVTAILYAFIHSARHDPSTGFLRRFSFLQEISKFLSLHKRKRPKYTHAFIEIRGTNILNIDSAYSEIFKLIPNLSALECVKINRAGRLSFQSAAIWVEYMGGTQRLQDILTELQSELIREAIAMQSTDVPALIVGAYVMESGDTDKTILTYTDIVIRQAIKEGTAALIFDDKIYAKLNYRAKIEQYIKHGLETNQLEVFYQPIVDFMTDKPVGFEALARLKNKEGESISPSVFIPIAEETGLISDVMDCVCDIVAKDMMVIAQAYSTEPRMPYININVAAVQLKDMKRTISALERARKGGIDVNVEITESSVLNTETAKEQIQRLSDAGFLVAVDDFGTGYSSIQRLNQYAFSTLKIDQSFVKGIEDRKAYSFLAAIVELARTASNNVIIEGIETIQQRILVMQMGVRYCQGYLYGRPMRIEGLKDHLADKYDIKASAQKRVGHISML